jgi:hypothetical protein
MCFVELRIIRFFPWELKVLPHQSYQKPNEEFIGKNLPVKGR